MDRIQPDSDARKRGDPRGVVGPYRVLEVLGRTGSVVECLARSRDPGQQLVRLRVLPLAIGRSAPAVARITELAARLTRVDQPHLARTLRCDRDPQDRDLFYYATEEISGVSLDELLAEQPNGVPVDQVLRWTSQLAGALEALHERGIVHGGVAPKNITIDPRDRAHLVGSPLQHLVATLMPAPMSGRSIRSETDTSRDVVALARMIYQTLAGAPPEDNGDPQPIPGVSARINIALLEVLATGRKRPPPPGAGALAAALRGQTPRSAPPALAHAPGRVRAAADVAPSSTPAPFAPLAAPASASGTRAAMLGAVVVTSLAVAGAWWWSGNPLPGMAGDPSAAAPPIVQGEPAADVDAQRLTQLMMTVNQAAAQVSDLPFRDHPAIRELAKEAGTWQRRASDLRSAGEDQEAEEAITAALATWRAAAARATLGHAVASMKPSFGDVTKGSLRDDQRLAALSSQWTAAFAAGRFEDAAATWRLARPLIEQSRGQDQAYSAAVAEMSRWQLEQAQAPTVLDKSTAADAGRWSATAELAEQYLEGGAFDAAADAWRQATEGQRRLRERNFQEQCAAEEWRDLWLHERSQALTETWPDDSAMLARRREAMAMAATGQRLTDRGDYLGAVDHHQRAIEELARARRLRDLEQSRRAAVSTDAQARAPEAPTGPAPAPELRAGDTMVDDFGHQLVYIDAGSFVMGSPAQEPGRHISERSHPVHLSEGFLISDTEVTRRQFARFAQETGHVTDAERSGGSHGVDERGQWRQQDGITGAPGFPQDDDHPVVGVSHRDAQAYCQWLSERQGATYRLPTEAEWERSCRAGTDTAFHVGDDPQMLAGSCNLADQAWAARFPGSTVATWHDQWVFTAPVGHHRPNPLGLHDMHGNVQEWCLDRYGDYPEGSAVDPLGSLPLESSSLRAAPHTPMVIRGGSFAAAPKHCRAAHRDAASGNQAFTSVGFRVVRRR